MTAPWKTVAIVGSRGFAAEWMVHDYVRDLASREAAVTILSGGARGVDTWVEEACRFYDVPFELFPALWEVEGRAAGYKRNARMLAEATHVVAFWDGVSKGTKHSIDLALESGLDLEVYFAR